MKKRYFSPILLTDIGDIGNPQQPTRPSQEHTPGTPEQNIQNRFAPKNLVDDWFPEETETLE